MPVPSVLLYHSVPTLIQFIGQDVDERVFEQLDWVDLEMLSFSCLAGS